MKIVAISDTHNLHRHWGREPWGDLPEGDVLVHCGDFTTHGEESEFRNFLSWFMAQPHPWKVFVAGNHDRCMEDKEPFNDPEHGVHYLKDSTIMIQGITFFGTPAHRKFQNFPFGYDDSAAKRFWSHAPSADVIISHGPAYGYCDDEERQREDHLGMQGLNDLLEDRHRKLPRLHLCGHVHHAETRQALIGPRHRLSINCSVHQWLWKKNPVQLPVVIDIGK